MMTTQIKAAVELAGFAETPLEDGDSCGAGQTKVTEASVAKRYSRS